MQSSINQPQNQMVQGQGQQQTGSEMVDRDYLNDTLALEKYLANGYNIATIEASNDQLYQVQLKHLQEIHQAQRNLFNLMNSKGWYQVEPAQSDKIMQKAQQFASYRSQFPYS